MNRNFPANHLILALSYASCGVSPVGASDGDVPSGSAQKGDVQLRFPTDGLLKATQSRAVTVPAVAGGTLRIIRLAHTGSGVKKGDIVLEFDPSQQEYLMAQNRSDLAPTAMPSNPPAKGSCWRSSCRFPSASSSAFIRH
jgi:multidrug efflux pump subunit AcrA (membrane-fusion protein)